MTARAARLLAAAALGALLCVHGAVFRMQAGSPSLSATNSGAKDGTVVTFDVGFDSAPLVFPLMSKCASCARAGTAVRGSRAPRAPTATEVTLPRCVCNP